MSRETGRLVEKTPEYTQQYMHTSDTVVQQHRLLLEKNSCSLTCCSQKPKSIVHEKQAAETSDSPATYGALQWLVY